jgi:hypothetical protein
MKDRYDKAVAYLTKHPDEIIHAWRNPEGEPGGRLFQFVGTTDGYGESCGCLTEVKDGIRRAQTPALTKAIRADIRIPKGPQWLTAKDLPVFAEWQRRLDKELNRK